MNIGYVYELSFEDGEKYIGITKVGLKRRLYTHKKRFKEKIIDAKVIDTVDLKDLYDYEVFYISEYKSNGFILKNKNNGGGGKLSYLITGEKYLNPVEALEKYPNDPKRKRVIKYDNFLNKMGEFESVAIAAFNEKIDHANISELLRGLRCRNNNQIWIYKEHEDKISEIKTQYNTKKECPFCLSDNTKKNGKYLMAGTYRYKCKSCDKSYNDLTYYPFLTNKLIHNWIPKIK